MDNDILIIDKPEGIPVHPNTYVNPAKTLVNKLAKITGREIYSVHRLDSVTSGVMVFACNSTAAAGLSRCFKERVIGKRYIALVRGYIEGTGTINIPLRPDKGRDPQEAETRFTSLCTTEIPEPIGRYAAARYSLVEAELVTGRPQQIRRHFQDVNHPVIGDKAHGDRDHNRFFRERFGSEGIFLRAYRLSFPHPNDPGSTVTAIAGIPDSWRNIFSAIGITIPESHPAASSITIN